MAAGDKHTVTPSSTSATPSPQPQPQPPSSPQSFFRQNAVVCASTVASICGVGVGFPFDLVKTRMQAFKYPSTFACIREIYTMEGITGFFTGIFPIMATVSVLRSITFTVYTGSKDRIFRFWDEVDAPPQWRDRDSLMPLIVASFGSGAMAGAVVATVNAPLEFIKVQRQLDALIQRAAALKAAAAAVAAADAAKSSQPPVMPSAKSPATAAAAKAKAIDVVAAAPNRLVSTPAGGMGENAAREALLKKATTTPRMTSSNNGPQPPASSSAPRAPQLQQTPRPPMSMWQWAKYIVKLKGLAGLYSGYSWHLARDFTGTALYFAMYESAKYQFLASLPSVPTPVVFMLSGGFAGTASWIFLYPLDLLKSVAQRDALSPTRTFTIKQFVGHRWRKYGIAGFYTGLGAQLVRSFPVHSLNFFVYETVLKWCMDS